MSTKVNFNWKQHLLAAGLFTAITLIYCLPMLQGKVLLQNDHIQGEGMSKEAQTFYEKTGELSLWTNSAFGGMPTYMIFMRYENNLMNTIGGYLSYGIPIPLNIILLNLLISYFLFQVMRFEWHISVAGAIGYALCSYSMISIEAGHVSKILALAYAPGVVAGVILVFRKQYWSGAAVMAFFTALEVYSNHIQITYYLFLGLAVYGIFELVWAIREKALKHFALSVLILGLAAAIGTATKTSTLLLNQEYAKETIRGGSELSKNSQASGGLDKDYAFAYSQGVMETFTLLIPNLYGGSSGGALGDGSATFSTLTGRGVPKNSARDFVQQLPLYWGDQTFTSGPVYAGVVILFFAVLALVASANRLKWWLLAAILWFITLAWGKNFSLLNDLMFDYFPVYNKFRAVTMIFGVIQLLLVILALLGLQWLIDQSENKAEVIKKAKPVVYGFAGLLVVFLVFGGAFLEFSGPNDEAFRSNMVQMTKDEGFANDILSAIREDREGMMRGDAIRSLLFLGLTLGVGYLFITKKLGKSTALWIIVALVLVDAWSLDKRYLNDKNFVKNKDYKGQFAVTAADQQILADPDPNFRVLNNTVNTFNSAIPSYHHKSIGGYHGAKIRRYQELIEYHISQNNQSVLNMLNTKYFIVAGEDRQPVAMQNPGAMGHGWTVPEILWVDSPDAELDTLRTTDLKQYAIVNKAMESLTSGYQPGVDSSAQVKLISYAPNKLKYEVSGSKSNVVVFSEIYYRGNVDWISSLDGKESPHFRANYVLRGMVVPAGKHEVEFRFEPPSNSKGQIVDISSSILVLLLAGVAIFMVYKGKE
jgi:hypothetical protein